MQDAYVAAADGLVRRGVRESGIPLTENLRHYVAVTLARYMKRHIVVDRLTIRVARAMDTNAPQSELRDLADACLLACSLFERRLRRSGGSLRHYSGLGETAYDAASLTEQAFSFAHMRDVIVAATVQDRPGPQALLDAARAGSTLARKELAQDNIIAFPGPRRLLH